MADDVNNQNLLTPPTPTSGGDVVNQAVNAPVNQPLAPMVNAPAPTPAPTPQQPHPLARALDSVLKTATGGDVYYTDPTGQRRLAPQSRGTLGKTLIAATLAGLLSKDEYRQTAYGPVRDYTGSAGNAFQAARGVTETARQQPQKLSDEAQARKLMTLQNNSQLVALQSAQARLANEKNDYRVKTEAHVDEMMTPFKDYEDLRTANNDPTQPKAFIDGGRGLTHEQALQMIAQKGNGATENNIIQDGWMDKFDEASGKMVPEPTYAILNPALKDITLPKNVTDVLEKVNSQYKDIHSIVGGTVRVPVNAYVSAMHDYQAVLTGQQTLDRLQQAVNPDAKPLTIEQVEKAARDSRDRGQNILPALYQLTHAIAGGQMPDQRPDNLLDVLLKAPNGGEVLKMIGLTPAEADEQKQRFNNERTEKEALAKAGGIGDKAPAPQQSIDKTQFVISQLPEEDQAALTAQLTDHPTNGQIRAINTQAERIRQNNREAAIKAGDPGELQTTANNAIEGDLTSIKDLLTSRQNVREKANNIMQDEARKRGLDPTRYTLGAQENKAALLKDYSGGVSTKTGAQITSFGALLGHINEGYDASESWTRSGSPLLNHSIKWLAENAENDQNFKRFQTDIIAPAKEYMNFLNANRAEHEQDIRSLDGVLNPSATPASVLTALRSFAKTADIRAAQLGSRYIQTVGTTYPIVDAQGAAVLNRLLGPGNSQAVVVSQAIPRGWQGGQATPVSRPVLQTIYNAAGRDKEMTRRIAAENGWIIPQQ